MPCIVGISYSSSHNKYVFHFIFMIEIYIKHNVLLAVDVRLSFAWFAGWMSFFFSLFIFFSHSTCRFAACFFSLYFHRAFEEVITPEMKRLHCFFNAIVMVVIVGVSLRQPTNLTTLAVLAEFRRLPSIFFPLYMRDFFHSRMEI